MKKTIAVIITFILCLSLTLSVSALTAPIGNVPASLGENYSSITLGGKTYKPVDSAIIYVPYDEWETRQAVVSKEQNPEIKSLTYDTCGTDCLINVDITLISGGTFSSYYMDEAYFSEYLAVFDGDFSTAVIDLEFPEGNTVKIEKSQLTGSPVVIDAGKLERGSQWYIYTVTENSGLDCYVGELYSVDGKYYYFDYVDARLNNIDIGALFFYDRVPVHEITDEKLISEIDEAKRKYYNDDFGLFVNENLAIVISDVFCTLLFGIVPLAVLITFLVLGIRSKTKYKKLFFALSGIGALGVLAFIAMLVVINII